MTKDELEQLDNQVQGIIGARVDRIHEGLEEDIRLPLPCSQEGHGSIDAHAVCCLVRAASCQMQLTTEQHKHLCVVLMAAVQQTILAMADIYAEVV